MTSRASTVKIRQTNPTPNHELISRLLSFYIALQLISVVTLRSNGSGTAAAQMVEGFINSKPIKTLLEDVLAQSPGNSLVQIYAASDRLSVRVHRSSTEPLMRHYRCLCNNTSDDHAGATKKLIEDHKIVERLKETVTVLKNTTSNLHNW